MSKKKKRRHRLGGPGSQNVALGQSELIVRTLAQEPRVRLRLNAAGVEKMSNVLLRFAEPILDRFAPLDEKKATLLFSITAWNYCLMSSEEQSQMRWELRHISTMPATEPTSRCSFSAKRNSTRAIGGCSWISKWQRVQAGCT